MILRRPKDFYSGALFLIIGGCTLTLASGLAFGMARSMGPGYFPMVLGGLLCCMAVALVAKGFVGRPEPMEPLNAAAARAALAVLGGTVLFGLLVRPAGLAPTLVVTTLVAALGMRNFGLKAAVVLAVVLAAGCSLVFVQLLGLPVSTVGPLFGT